MPALAEELWSLGGPGLVRYPHLDDRAPDGVWLVGRLPWAIDRNPYGNKSTPYQTGVNRRGTLVQVTYGETNGPTPEAHVLATTRIRDVLEHARTDPQALQMRAQALMDDYRHGNEARERLRKFWKSGKGQDINFCRRGLERLEKKDLTAGLTAKEEAEAEKLTKRLARRTPDWLPALESAHSRWVVGYLYVPEPEDEW